MGKLEHYALDFDAIEPTLAEYFQDKGNLDYTYEQVNDFTYRVSVTKENVKKPGLLIIYNKQGLYCMDPGGTPTLKGICTDCRDYIIQRLQIPNAVRQSFCIKDVDAELAAACVVCLGANYTVSDEKGDVPDAKHYIVTDAYRSSVSVICYDNGTIFVQGAYTALFLKVITEISKEISAAPEVVVKELLNIAPLVQNRYEVDINSLIGKPKPLIDNNLDVMVLSSAVLANSAVAIGDYGAYPFGVLKAIEGLLALKLQTHLNSDYESFGKNCFSPDAHGIQRLNVPDFNDPSQTQLKAAIESSYNFYNNHRHSTFHTKKLNVVASRILTEEDALEIIDDGLDLINKLCDNW